MTVSIREKNIPAEVINHILSFLDIKSLGRFQQIATPFTPFPHDTVWQNLFKTTYAMEEYKGLNGKQGLKNILPIQSKSELLEKIEAFLCRVKWEETLQMECIFPDLPADIRNNYACIPVACITSNFGPTRGQCRPEQPPEPNEKKYYCFTGDAMPLLLNQKGDESYFTKIDNLGGIPFSYSLFSPISLPTSNYVALEVEGIDVGYGNTLGYFCSIDDWKEPFKLFWIQGKWVGLMPYSDFKFVKIAPNGSITWENISNNRSWGPRYSGRPYGIREYLQYFPISFPS